MFSPSPTPQTENFEIPKEHYDSDDVLSKNYNDCLTASTTPGELEPDRVFAPLDVPMHRRAQTLVLLWHTCSIPVFLTLFLLSLSLPVFWPVLVFYFTFFYLGNQTPNNGKSFVRRSTWMRNWKMWQFFNEYFPITLHKTVDLEPTFKKQEFNELTYRWPFSLSPSSRVVRLLRKTRLISPKLEKVTKEVKTGPRYIFGYHPHGIISMGVTGSFATNGAGFDNMFPGIRVFLLTLLSQFRIPFYRDYLLGMGISSVTKHNVMALVRENQSVCIVVGGASESLLAQPGMNDIVLHKRKGFVKIALELGDVCLVPVYGFGETDIYKVFNPNTRKNEKSLRGRISYVVNSLQVCLKNKTGFTVPLFHARGVFNYDFGLLPFRKPIHIVVGKPVNVPFVPSPSQHQIDYYHDLYVKELQRVFDDNKAKFLSNGSSQLRIIE